jgi:hypothetical protein
VLYNAGLQPSNQITTLRQATTTTFHSSNIYNLNSRFKHKKLRRLEATDVLIEHLKEKRIYYTVKLNKDNCTEHFFIALPSAIKLALKHQDIVLVDNTYKTNKFDMPLLHLVGKCRYRLKSTFTGPYRLLTGLYIIILRPIRPVSSL